MQNKFIIRCWRYNVKNLEKPSNFAQGFSIIYITFVIDIIIKIGKQIIGFCIKIETICSILVHFMIEYAKMEGLK